MADLVETLQNAGSFDTLLKALEAADLVGNLKGEETLTLFAPVDGAFAQIKEDSLNEILSNEAKIKKILTYHLVFGDVRSQDLVDLDDAKTMEGSLLKIDTSQGYKVNQATIVQPDLLADNGVIHVIDSVLTPAILK
jgi:uncharacterized surface protein with fasciclin (FAS1) repeats